MPQIELHDVFKSPRGIVEGRWDEIESAGYGAFDRILDEEVRKQFLSTEHVAYLMDACTSTARRWLRDHNPRYIVYETKTLYLREDAEAVVAARTLAKETKKAKKAA